MVWYGLQVMYSCSRRGTANTAYCDPALSHENRPVILLCLALLCFALLCFALLYFTHGGASKARDVFVLVQLSRSIENFPLQLMERRQRQAQACRLGSESFRTIVPTFLALPCLPKVGTIPLLSMKEITRCPFPLIMMLLTAYYKETDARLPCNWQLY